MLGGQNYLRVDRINIDNIASRGLIYHARHSRMPIEWKRFMDAAKTLSVVALMIVMIIYL